MSREYSSAEYFSFRRHAIGELFKFDREIEKLEAEQKRLNRVIKKMDKALKK
jgi:hypothetical protein